MLKTAVNQPIESIFMGWFVSLYIPTSTTSDAMAAYNDDNSD
jgi:hypothetical protein